MKKMVFRCSNCNFEWIISKDKLLYIENWPDLCPCCGSLDISHELAKEINDAPKDLVKCSSPDSSNQGTCATIERKTIG